MGFLASRQFLPRSCADPNLCSGSWFEPWASTAFVSGPCWLVQGFDLCAPYSPHPSTYTSYPSWQSSALTTSFGISSSCLLLCLLVRAYHDAVCSLEFEIQRIRSSEVMSEGIVHQIFPPWVCRWWWNKISNQLQILGLTPAGQESETMNRLNQQSVSQFKLSSLLWGRACLRNSIHFWTNSVWQKAMCKK